MSETHATAGDPLLVRELLGDFAHLERRADQLLAPPPAPPRHARPGTLTGDQLANRVLGALSCLMGALGLMVWWIAAGVG